MRSFIALWGAVKAHTLAQMMDKVQLRSFSQQMSRFKSEMAASEGGVEGDGGLSRSPLEGERGH